MRASALSVSPCGIRQSTGKCERWEWPSTDRLPLVARSPAATLRGQDLADLPVEQATMFEPVVNLKIAKALGIKIRQSILMGGIGA